ncbi:MAG: glucosaminidase domain-containing protein [Chitinophagaceae bacterium]
MPSKRFRIFLLVVMMVSLKGWSQEVDSSQPMTTSQYIATYKDLAESEMQRTGVPAAISLAQGIVESDSGNGWLVLHSNNHFGIKCKNNWTGQTISHDDDAKNECFRKYASAQDSWEDHSDFLKGNARYSFLFQLDPRDFKDWATGLKEAGYATSPNYAQKLIRIIEENDLQQYTLEALQMEKLGGSSVRAPILSSPGVAISGPLHSVKTDQDPSTPLPSTTGVQTYPSGVFKINGSPVIFLPGGSSLLTLAEKYRIKLRKLLRFNDLKKNDLTLNQGMLIYLKKKPNRGVHDGHLVRMGENMQSISQKEDIQLKWLYKRNRLRMGQQPAIGSDLVLRGFASSAPSLATHIYPIGNTREMEVTPGPPVPTQKKISADSVQDEPLGSQQQQINSQEHTDTFPPHSQRILIQNPLNPPARNWPKIHIQPRHQPSSDSLAHPSQTVLIDQDQDPPPHFFPREGLHHTVLKKSYSRMKTRARSNRVKFYTVRKGDSLYGVARRFRVKISQLKLWNHLLKNAIRIGQRLKIKP